MLVSSLAVAYNSWRLTRHDGRAHETADGALEAAP